MGDTLVTGSKLVRIADAIRNKLGVSKKYTLDEMPSAISSIQTSGGGEVIGGDGNASYVKLGSVTLHEGMTEAFLDKNINPNNLLMVRYVVTSTAVASSTIKCLTGSGTQANIASIGIFKDQKIGITEVVPPSAYDSIGAYVIHGGTYSPQMGVCYSRKYQNTNKITFATIPADAEGMTLEVYAINTN